MSQIVSANSALHTFVPHISSNGSFSKLLVPTNKRFSGDNEFRLSLDAKEGKTVEKAGACLFSIPYSCNRVF